jgi:hypothetical protein
MKTPRELLLARGAGMQPELNRIRKELVADLRAAHFVPAPEREPRMHLFLRGLSDLRWHLAAASALWILVGILQSTSGSGELAAGENSPRVSQLDQKLLTALEQRRHLLILMEDDSRDFRSTEKKETLSPRTEQRTASPSSERC